MTPTDILVVFFQYDEKQMVLETSVYSLMCYMTRLLARESFIEISHCESCRWSVLDRLVVGGAAWVERIQLGP